jgi:FlaG/FlaF family flagellin (archaellin)
MMNMRGWVMVAALGMLSSVGAHATPLGDTFEITLDGWAPGETFTLTSFSSDQSTRGFTQNELCPNHDWWACTCDPGAKLTVPKDADYDYTGSPFTLTADSNGDLTATFTNTGPTIDALELTTTITNTQANQDIFTCSIVNGNTGGSIPGSFCGISVTGDPKLVVLYNLGPNGIIGTAVPEPAEYALLLIGFAGIIVTRRIRSQRVAA